MTGYEIYATISPISLFFGFISDLFNHSVDIFISCLRLLFMKCLLTVDEILLMLGNSQVTTVRDFPE